MRTLPLVRSVFTISLVISVLGTTETSAQRSGISPEGRVIIGGQSKLFALKDLFQGLI